MTIATPTGIQQLQLAYFGRPSDPAALTAWPASGLSIEAIVLQFVRSAEYQRNTVDPNSTANAGGSRTFNDTNLINSFYLRLFGRLAVGSEVAGWSSALASGAVNYDYLGLTILNAGLNLPTTGAAGEMRAVLVAKVQSNDVYTGILYNNPASAAAYSTAAAIQDGIAYSSVTTTSTPQTLVQAQAAVATMVTSSGSGGGQAFTLTTSIDNFRATAANSVFTGISSEVAASNTFQTFDTLGGTGIGNVLNIYAIDYTGGANLAPATVSGIQTINIRATDATAADVLNVNANNFVGATAFNSDRSTSAITLTNLATGAAAGMIGNGLTTNGAFTFGYSTAADAATLNISGGTLAGNVAIGSTPSAVTFNSTGAANTIGTVNLGGSARTWTINAATGLTAGNITGAALTTINVSGAAATAIVAGAAANEPTSAVQLGTLPAAVTTINASGMTAGGVAVTLVPTVTSFIGGAGTDTVTTAALTTTTASAINAGAGTDVLRIANVTEVDTSGEANLYSGFETLDALATAANINLSLFGNSTFTALRVGGNAVFTNLNATQAANVTVYANSSANYGLAGATTPGNVDTLSLIVNDGLVANNTITLANIAAAGVENININAVDNVTISSLTNATALSQLQFTGGRNVNVTTGALGVILNSAIRASALTGTFTVDASAATGNGFGVTGSATRVNTLTLTNQADAATGGTASDFFRGLRGDDTITTGAGGNDTVIGNLGVDTINLQGANDTIVIRPGDSYQYGTTGAAMVNTITAVASNGNGVISFSYTINGITVAGTAGAAGATASATDISNAIRAAIAANPEVASYVTVGGTTTVTLTAVAGAPLSVVLNAITTAGAGSAPTGAVTTTTNSGASSGTLTVDTVTGLNLGGSSAGTGVDTISLTGLTATGLSVVTGGAMAGANLSAAVTALFAAGGALNGTTNAAGIFTFSGDTYLVGNVGASGTAFGSGTAITDAASLLNAQDFILKVNGFTGTLDASDFTFTA